MTEIERESLWKLANTDVSRKQSDSQPVTEKEKAQCSLVLQYSGSPAPPFAYTTLHYTTHTHTHTGCCAALEKGMSGSVGGGATSMLKLPNLTRLSPVTVWEVQHTAYQHV